MTKTFNFTSAADRTQLLNDARDLIKKGIDKAFDAIVKMPIDAPADKIEIGRAMVGIMSAEQGLTIAHKLVNVHLAGLLPSALASGAAEAVDLKGKRTIGFGAPAAKPEPDVKAAIVDFDRLFSDDEIAKIFADDHDGAIADADKLAEFQIADWYPTDSKKVN